MVSVGVMGGHSGKKDECQLITCESSLNIIMCPSTVTGRVSVSNLSRKCAVQQFHFLKVKAACVTMTCENE